MGISESDPSHVMTVADGPQSNPEQKTLLWTCAGCGGIHVCPVRSSTPERPSWEWDGNLVAPTLSPSILKHAHGGGQVRCHSFVKAGVVQFLHDCDHHLAGQSVAMLPRNADPFGEPEESNE